ncbi:MAG: hypothetical protein ACOY3P_06280, partial [Planctomycetota bacterium]
MKSAQSTRIGQMHFMTVTAILLALVTELLPPTSRQLGLRVRNPLGGTFDGSVRLTDVRGLTLSQPAVPLTLSSDAHDTEVLVGLAKAPADAFSLGLELVARQGRVEYVR